MSKFLGKINDLDFNSYYGGIEKSMKLQISSSNGYVSMTQEETVLAMMIMADFLQQLAKKRSDDLKKETEKIEELKKTVINDLKAIDEFIANADLIKPLLRITTK